MHRSGIALMIIDHNLSFVLDVADYVHVMANGRLIASGTPDEIAASALVRQVYLERRHERRRGFHTRHE